MCSIYPWSKQGTLLERISKVTFHHFILYSSSYYKIRNIYYVFLWTGTSDPYATIHIMSTKKGKDKDADNDNFNVTKVEFATLNPKWNESFTM